MSIISSFVFTLVVFFLGGAQPCFRRSMENGFVCVCNATSCDEIPALTLSDKKSIAIYYTSKTEPGFNLKESYFSLVKNDSVGQIKLTKQTLQTIHGFGGAFTDSTGINIHKLPKSAQTLLLESYFGSRGLGYSLCKVPVGGSDFSTRPYSYDDVDGDRELNYFKLQTEDFLYKIPLINQAKKLRGDNGLALFASTWTAPPWMKNFQVWQGFSQLKKENYQLFADYHKRFFEEYEKRGIKFWGVTTGNEPLSGFLRLTQTEVNSMGWLPTEQAKWLRENFGPTLRNSSYKDLKIVIFEDSTITLPHVASVICHGKTKQKCQLYNLYTPVNESYFLRCQHQYGNDDLVCFWSQGIEEMLGDERNLPYIDGVSTHWYRDNEVDPRVRYFAVTEKKETFLISSEACYFQTLPILGSWERAAGYIGSIFEYLKWGFTGWIDWNMVLNMQGGPTYINFTADAPVIISDDGKEFYKQPMFYALGHFSKFVVPGSKRLILNYTGNTTSDEVQILGFLRPDNITAIIVFNNGTTPAPVQINNYGKLSNVIQTGPKSISTILYRD